LNYVWDRFLVGFLKTSLPKKNSLGFLSMVFAQVFEPCSKLSLCMGDLDPQSTASSSGPP